MLAQTFMSSRSLTQGLDVINMEPSAPGVRTSVINSYLSNTGGQAISNSTSPGALMASLGADSNTVQRNYASNAVNETQLINTSELTHQSSQDPTVVSPRIYSVIKNSIVQALNDQLANSQAMSGVISRGASSNVNALLSNQLTPGSMVDAAGAQINSFVNSLIFTVQSQTNLSSQELLASPVQASNLNALPVTNPQTPLSPYPVRVENAATSSAGPQPLDGGISLTGVNSTNTQYAPNLETSSSNLSGSQANSAQVNIVGSGSNSAATTAQQQETAQNISNVHGWVVSRVYSSVQSMIEMLVVTQSHNAEQSAVAIASGATAGLDSLIQSANSLFASMGLTSTVTASTLQTALQDIQRNLMSAPAQGQWINVVA